jgi:hypothetical protein
MSNSVQRTLSPVLIETEGGWNENPVIDTSVVAERALLVIIRAAAHRPQQNFPVDVCICSSPGCLFYAGTG